MGDKEILKQKEKTKNNTIKQHQRYYQTILQTLPNGISWE